MVRTSGLYKDFPQEYTGNLIYHVDLNLSTGGFSAIWIIYWFVSFCVTAVLIVVVRRSVKGKTYGTGVLLIMFNLLADLTFAFLHIFFLTVTGGDLSRSLAGMVIYVWFTFWAGYIQIYSVVAMFHLRRKMMQDMSNLVKGRIYNGRKIIIITIVFSVVFQTIVVFGPTPNWRFSQKWYVHGEIDSDAPRIMGEASLSASGYDNTIYILLGLVQIVMAIIVPIFYNLYCMYPVLRLMQKFRKQGIISSEVQSLARLTITLFLLFLFFNTALVVIGFFQQRNTEGAVDGRGLTWVVQMMLGPMFNITNAIACYVFFPRFRAYGKALLYDIIGKKDVAREIEAVVEKEIEDYDQTMTKGATVGQTTAQTETTV